MSKNLPPSRFYHLVEATSLNFVLRYRSVGFVLFFPCLEGLFQV